MAHAAFVLLSLTWMSFAHAQTALESSRSHLEASSTDRLIWPFPRLGYSMFSIPLAEAYAINGAGAIAGAVNGNAAIYQNGAVTVLQGKVGYTNLRALDISNTGSIVGTGISAGHQRALFWQSATAAPLDMGGLGMYMYPQAINDYGTVVGYFDADGRSSFQAFKWAPGIGYTLITPSGTTSAQALGISNSGYIAGVANYSGIGQQAVRWYPSGAVGRITGPAFAKRALDSGSVFGRGNGGSTLWNLSNTATLIGPEPASHVVEQRNDALRWVGYTWPPNSRPWTSIDTGVAAYLPIPTGAYGFANDVNSCGTVLGSIVESNGTARPVYWSKVFCDSLPPIAAQ